MLWLILVQKAYQKLQMLLRLSSRHLNWSSELRDRLEKRVQSPGKDGILINLSKITDRIV